MATSSDPFPLTDWAQLAIGGADAEEFLHGQFTNDLKALEPGRAQFSAYCVPKGGVLFNFLIWREKDTYKILLPTDQTEAMAQRLSMFRLRAAVDIEQPDGVSFAALPTPHEPLALTVEDGVTTIGWLDGARAIQLGPAAPPGEPGDAQWRRWDIEAGIPFVRAGIREQFVAQYLNLDAWDAISFEKGCYPGQEVVARLHYLGKLKHRTYLLRFPADTTLATGDALYPQGESRDCGQIVDAQAGDDGLLALAVVRRETAEASTLCAHAGDGPQATQLPLPYALPDEAA